MKDRNGVKFSRNTPVQELDRNSDNSRPDGASMPYLMTPSVAPQIAVAVLTGGADRPYAYGLATELIAKQTPLDLIGGDDLDCPEFREVHRITFLNLRG